MTEHDARAVMDVFNGYAGHVVALSSMDVYRAFDRLIRRDPGPPDPTPFTETGPLRERLYPFRQAEPRPADDPVQWRDDYDKIVVERPVLGDPGLPGTALRLPFVYGPGDYQRRLFPYVKRMDDDRPAILLSETQIRWRASRVYVENAAEAVALAIGNPVAFGNVYNVADSDVLTEEQWVAAIGREEAIARTIAWDRAHPPDTIDPAQFDYEAEDRLLAALG